jgi:hypothetical protein
VGDALRADNEIKVGRNKIKAGRNEIKAWRNDFQIRRNKIKILKPLFSTGYDETVLSLRLQGRRRR